MKIMKSKYANVLIAVIAVLCNVFTYPIGGGNRIVGIPLPYIAFEPATDGSGLVDFSSPISPVLFLFDVAVCFLVISLLKRLVFRKRPVVDTNTSP